MLLRQARLHVARFFSFAILYLALVDTVEPSEVVASILVASVATFAVGSFSANNKVHFSFRPSWLKAICPLPYRILKDSALVLATLVRKRWYDGDNGHFYGWNPEQSHSAGWRALKVLQISIVPNTYAVIVDRDTSHILIHELVRRTEGSSDSSN